MPSLPHLAHAWTCIVTLRARVSHRFGLAPSRDPGVRGPALRCVHRRTASWEDGNALLHFIEWWVEGTRQLTEPLEDPFSGAHQRKKKRRRRNPSEVGLLGDSEELIGKIGVAEPVTPHYAVSYVTVKLSAEATNNRIVHV
jgi:hypothetical protein